MSRAQELAAIKPPYDPANPPEGVRLRVASVAADLRVSLADLCQAAGVGKATMWRITAENSWPVRSDTESIRKAVEGRLEEAGATPEQLATLWHAQTRRHVMAPPTKPPVEEPKETDVLLPKQTLNMAARKAFALFTNPFDAEVRSDDELFTNADIAFCAEACWQAAVGGRFVALVGESGAGKTTIVQDMKERIARDKKRVLIIRPSVLGMEDSDSKGKTIKSNDILSAIITAVDSHATVPQTVEARTLKAERLLKSSLETGYQHLLVIEEAHCMPDATLKHLKRLHEMQVGRRPLLGILLVAQPELLAKLNPTKANLREVTQRCEIVQLMPLGADLKGYLAHRAQVAKRPLSDFIDDAGIEALRERLTVRALGKGGKEVTASLTYPLAVNNLFIAALNAAAETGVPKITRNVVFEL
jgi:type II secretory pathway predicted ATPase ExeA